MRYVAAIPASVSGQGGHDQTYRVAAILVHGFGLGDGEAWGVLTAYNARCVPPWSESDLRHKLVSAGNPPAPHANARGHLLKASTPRRDGRSRAPKATTAPSRPAASPAPSYDLSGAGELPDEIPDGARELIRAAFKAGEGIRIVPATLGEDQKEIPEGGGISLSREEWLRKLDSVKGNPNGIWSNSNGCGIYIAVNPYKVGATLDRDVSDYRHALVEFDSELSLGEQFKLYQDSNLPCAAVIFSGGKSVHAWVKIDAKDRAEFDERMAILYDHFQSAGLPIDTKNKNPGRLSRLPFCRRFKRRQELIALNIGADSFTEWLKGLENDALGKCLTFDALSALNTDNDPNCVIGFREGKSLRYLCKGKAAWILGPSGIGKSSLIIEFAVGWALNRHVFGMMPCRPLKSLIIQAENDDYDLAEMVQGIGEAHGLMMETEEWIAVNQNVIFKTETRATGEAFVERLHRLIDREKPDIVWIDPMLSFMGIDVNKQTEATKFLREMLTPVLESTGAVLIGIHHTGKPKSAKETAAWTAIDWAYQGLGSSELVNWARAVMFLRPIGDGFFELKLAKRGSRAGAIHPDGKWTNSVWLKHAAKGIRWEQTEPPEEKKDEKRNDKHGRPSKVDALIAIGLGGFIDATSTEGEGLREISRRLEAFAATKKADVSEATCRRAVALMVSNGAMVKKEKLYFKA